MLRTWTRVVVSCLILAQASGFSLHAGMLRGTTRPQQAGFCRIPLRQISPTKHGLRTLAHATLGSTMQLRTAKTGDIVGVQYKGTLDNGEVFDQNLGGPLLEFEVGSGRVIKAFDEAVRGLAVGDSRKVRCDPKDAYGEYNEENVASLPVSQMPEPPAGMKLEPGLVLQLPTGHFAMIKSIKDDVCVLDGNHPLAGKTLNFDVTLGMIMDREKALERKINELRAVLDNPLMSIIAADVTKDSEYIARLQQRLDTVSDKSALIDEIIGSEEWRQINLALMSNPELMKFVRDPAALEALSGES